jgi:hypothetical protein
MNQFTKKLIAEGEYVPRMETPHFSLNQSANSEDEPTQPRGVLKIDTPAPEEIIEESFEKEETPRKTATKITVPKLEGVIDQPVQSPH